MKTKFLNLVKTTGIKVFFRQQSWQSVFLLVFALIGLALPLRLARASIISGILSLPTILPAAMLLFIFQVILALSSVGLQISGWVLSLVTSENFIRLSYTGIDNPLTGLASNPIVNAGWLFMRDLTNMLFIIVLVLIGLGTALKLSGYEAKKTLPRLIGIALLINFTPVILGIMIDASNIFMRFFLGKYTGFELGIRSLVSQGNILLKMIADLLPTFGLSVQEALVKTIILLIFNSVFAVTLYCFAAIFAIRYIAIWILVILSPLAFACNILPSTRSVWNQWWRLFTQWCLIGIVAGFFLYLSNFAMVESPNIVNQLSFTTGGGLLAQPILHFLESIFPYFVPIVFLFFGFFTALSTSAMGASTIVRFAQKQTRAVGAVAGKWVAGTTKTKVGGWAREHTPEGVKQWAKKWATMPTPGLGEKGAGAQLKRAAASPLYTVTRAIGGTAIQVLGAPARRNAIRKGETEMEKFDDPDLIVKKLQQTSSLGNRDMFVGALSTGLGKGKKARQAIQKSIGLSQAEEAIKAANAAEDSRTATRIYAAYMDQFEPAEKNEPELKSLREALGFKDLDEDEQKKYKNFKEKIIAEMKGEDMDVLSEAFWDSDAATDAATHFWKGSQIRQAADKFGTTFVEKYREAVEKKNAYRFVRENPSGAIFLTSNAAQELGLEAPGGMDREDIRKKINEIREEREKRREAGGEILTPREEAYVKREAFLRSEHRRRHGLPVDETSDWLEAEKEFRKYREGREEKSKDLKRWEKQGKLPSSPTPPETRRIAKIVDAPASVPVRADPAFLREVRGALKKVHESINETQRKIINRTDALDVLYKTKEEEEKLRTNPSRTPKEDEQLRVLTAEIPALTIKIADLEDEIGDDSQGLKMERRKYLTTEQELKQKEELIKSSLVSRIVNP
ncbi:MAG: hypothetical protein COT34_02345 [Candidatus Nealsonbacteria bacterium CG08_land_8_20_14_0_20_43_11]|uniref:Uncharacterized protein n=1 Tax=Candidatus Nealsonbacteria bacterium CG08_land_8_20_14_0_20_43_11 TaxID=1974706 RepID=A0A2M6T0B5_9BACT|nr:MAG: hypothetical protein COT34_02345 [Candidatus Nealsonbacteria bacterium CG08_land_8_20_14_0_20_43_11]